MSKSSYCFFMLLFLLQILQAELPNSGQDALNLNKINLNKINGSQMSEKTLLTDSILTDIENSMKTMEDNILKLMRELGALKMQVTLLKNNMKKEVLPAVLPAALPQADESASQDIAVTVTLNG